MRNRKFYPQAFVSSTRIDLLSERNIASRICISQNVMPLGMELFSAADQERWDFIREAIEPCDFVVLLLGGRYGSLNLEDCPYKGLSYTHSEFRFAIDNKIPVFRFLRIMSEGEILDANRDAPDKFEATKRMIEFRTEVQDKICGFWTDDKDRILRGEHEPLESQLTRIIGNQRRTLYNQYQNEIQNTVERKELDLVNGALRDLLRSTQESRIQSTSNDFDHSHLLNSAGRVRIMMNDGYRFFEKYLVELRGRAQRGLPTDICLLADEGPHVELVARKSLKSKEEQARDSLRSIHLLKSIFENSNALKLFGMNGYFSYCLFQYDDVILISLYLNYKREEELPMIELRKTRVTGDVYYTILQNTDRLFRAADAGDPVWFVRY